MNTARSMLVIKYDHLITFIVLLGGEIKSKKEKPESGDACCNMSLNQSRVHASFHHIFDFNTINKYYTKLNNKSV